MVVSVNRLKFFSRILRIFMLSLRCCYFTRSVADFLLSWLRQVPVCPKNTRSICSVFKPVKAVLPSYLGGAAEKEWLGLCVERQAGDYRFVPLAVEFNG